MTSISPKFEGNPQSTLRNYSKTHSIYSHRFLQAARDKTLSLDAVKNFALQELFISLSFPSMMAEVVARIPFHREDLRLPIIQNMYEEMGNGELSKSHPQLLRNLAIELGASKSELENNQPTKETTESLTRLIQQCRGHYTDALVSIGYGNEYWLLIEYPPMKKACKEHGVSAEVLSFFDVNIEADVSHTKNVELVLFQEEVSQSTMDKYKRVLSESLDARAIFYDGICNISGMT